MTNKQRRFADEYLIDCNASKAAKRAGYESPSYASTLLATPEIRAYIDEQLARIHNENIAEAEEVLEFLTAMMRGNSKEQVVMRVGGEQTLEMIDVSARERLKAAELIGKRYGMFVEKPASKSGETVIICGDDEVK